MIDGMIDACSSQNWTKVYGEEPQLEWVLLSYPGYYTMNWYIETELHHGTSEWDILCEGFLLTFTFEEHWWDIIDDVLQAIKAVIFKIPQEPIEVIQPKWATQLSCPLECYNMNTEEDDKDPQKVNIP